MDIREFMGLLEVKDMTAMVGPKVGTKFLNGIRMIAQKEIKTLGQEISWYEVINSNPDGSFSYGPRYGKLIKKMEEQK